LKLQIFTEIYRINAGISKYYMQYGLHKMDTSCFSSLLLAPVGFVTLVGGPKREKRTIPYLVAMPFRDCYSRKSNERVRLQLQSRSTDQREKVHGEREKEKKKSSTISIVDMWRVSLSGTSFRFGSFKLFNFTHRRFLRIDLATATR